MVEYCSPLWDPAKLDDISHIEDIQRQFTRCIVSCRGLSYWDRLKKLNLRSLQRRREQYIVIHVRKIANKLAPNDIGMEFRMHPRLGLKAIIPSQYRNAQRSVQTAYENSFGVRGAKLFNLSFCLKQQTVSLNWVPLKLLWATFFLHFPIRHPSEATSL